MKASFLLQMLLSAYHCLAYCRLVLRKYASAAWRVFAADIATHHAVHQLRNAGISGAGRRVEGIKLVEQEGHSTFAVAFTQPITDHTLEWQFYWLVNNSKVDWALKAI